MKRGHIHTVFGCAALGLALIAAYHGTQLEHAKRVNDAIARADTAQLDSSVPEAVFAHAVALSRVSGYQDAAKTYKSLIQGEPTDLRLAALYNLGNLYMREALKNETDAAIHALPLIELAKQSYRDLLRDNPADWDARYNLERALRLAPEISDAAIVESGPEVWNKRVLRATQGFRIELP
jgi:mxaK protein